MDIMYTRASIFGNLLLTPIIQCGVVYRKLCETVSQCTYMYLLYDCVQVHVPLFLVQNRKNDETAYMQMLKLKRDLEKAM